MTSVHRRQLVAGIMLAGVGWLGREVRAQPSHLIKIGALTESWGPTPAFVGLRDGLVELGYREDKHFTIGVRFTEGRPDDLPAAARDLVRRGVDIIVTGESTTAAKAAQMATNRIPIVFIGSGDDPVAVGLVKSIARPGANITGIADLDVELAPKRMEIFRELVPTLKRVLLPYNATNPDVVAHVAAHRRAAQSLGLTLVERPLRSEEEARKALTGLRKGEADGVMSLRFLSLNISGFILEGAPRAMIPTMFHIPYFVERGGLASYSAGAYPLGLQAARLVDKILKGAKPGEVPVEQPWKFELVVNLKAAKTLALAIPPSVLLRADHVIE